MSEIVCPYCKGSGEAESDCHDCQGSGYDPHEDKPFAQCDECGGEGTKEQDCLTCGGTGIAYEDDD